MRLRKRGFVMFGTTMAVGALLGACTPEPPPTGPTPVPTPTPSATTPTESPVEREQRLNFEAAEKAYRDNLAEQLRLYHRGGAPKATKALKATATGDYLSFTVEQLRDLKKRRLTVKGDLRVVGVARTAWKEGSVVLTSCEDASKTRIIDRRGRDVTPSGLPRAVQELTVVHQRGIWRVKDRSSILVENFKGRACAG